jgi:hypothetical protein
MRSFSCWARSGWIELEKGADPFAHRYDIHSDCNVYQQCNMEEGNILSDWMHGILKLKTVFSN